MSAARNGTNIVPHSNDVLFGRGFTISAHPGNRHLRNVVQANKKAFLEAKKKEKRKIARRIVDEVQRLDPPGRFLIEDPTASSSEKEGILDKVWFSVDVERAVDKVMHRLREKEKPPSAVGPSNDTLYATGGMAGLMPNHSAAGVSVPLTQQIAHLAPQDLSRFLQNMQQQQSLDPNLLNNLAIQEQRQHHLLSQLNSQTQQQVKPFLVGLNDNAIVQQPHVQQQMHMQMANRHPVTHQFQNQQPQDLQALTQQPQASMQAQPNNLQGNEATLFGSASEGPFATSAVTTTNQSQQSQGESKITSPVLSALQNQLNTQAIDSSQQIMDGRRTMRDALPSAEQVNTQASWVPGTEQQINNQLQLSQSQQGDLSADTGLWQNIFNAEPASDTSSPPIFDQLQICVDQVQESPQSKGNKNEPPRESDANPQEVAASVDPFEGGKDDFDDIMGSFFDVDALSTSANDMPQQQQQFETATLKTNQEQFRTLTLREWVCEAMAQSTNDSITPGRLLTGFSQYVKATIPLALKLAEFLVDMENQQVDPVPLASIRYDNILVHIDESNAETIHHITINCCASDSPDLGDSSGRLFATGVVMYELLSSQSYSPGSLLSATSIGNISLADGQMVNFDSSRKKARSPVYTGEMDKLESIGIPWSLCSVVGNLLESAKGDLRRDEAYDSLEDLCTDLRLMKDDPLRFLDGVHVGLEPALDTPNKLYGRKNEILMIENSYERHFTGACGGILVSGGAGVGKSSLVFEVTRKLALKSGSYFLTAKFNQDDGASPLSTIATCFRSLCDSFSKDAAPSQLEAVRTGLRSSLGRKGLSILASVVPSLMRLISFPVMPEDCIDMAATMQFAFRKLLEELSQHRRVIFFLDDLQFADLSSLLLIASMLSHTKESSNVFFSFCYRDEDLQVNGPFATWLSSINAFPLSTLDLGNMSMECVNELVSETLHIFPRITRPLASVLHHRTGGNPLFLRQLLESLKEQGHLYLKTSPPTWAWDLDRIENIEASDNVVALLVKEMGKLNAAPRMVLESLACFGSCVKFSVIHILSQDVGLNIRAHLKDLEEKGYVRVDDSSSSVQFCHDNIQQAAYKIMTPTHAKENHIRFGLSVVSRSFDETITNDELFFIAVNQINRGGVDSLVDPRRKIMAAALNLKAGKRSEELSDFSTAYALYNEGISFLDPNECWTAQYKLSLDLYDAAVQTACTINDAISLRRLSSQVIAKARCGNDKLNSLYAVAKSLRLAFKFADSEKVASTMLQHLGQSLPRSIDDARVFADIKSLKAIISSISDETIMSMKESKQPERDVIILKIYQDLIFLLSWTDPKRAVDNSFRMMQTTMTNGLCAMSPIVYAQFGCTLVKGGDVELGYRLGTLALRLLDKVKAQRYTSSVISLVGGLISWVNEPMQAVAESHKLGVSHGQRNGDTASSHLNNMFQLSISLVSSCMSLSDLRVKSEEFVKELLEREQQFLLKGSCLTYLQAVAFIEGLDYSEEGNTEFPSWDGIVTSQANAHQDFQLILASHQYSRAFLFKQYNHLPQEGILERITQNNVALRPLFIWGIFFEGLVSFQLARQIGHHEQIRKGETALSFFKTWSSRNEWNFANKALLLEAEFHVCTSRDYEKAEDCYVKSIKSAREHKFTHEEAIASELAAKFFYDKGLLQKSYYFFQHSANCYKKWGALALARGIEIHMANTSSPGSFHHGSTDNSLTSLFTEQFHSKKRHQ